MHTDGTGLTWVPLRSEKYSYKTKVRPEMPWSHVSSSASLSVLILLLLRTVAVELPGHLW